MKTILYIGGFELPDRNAAAQRVMSNALLLREMGYRVVFVGTTKEEGCKAATIQGFECHFVQYPHNALQWFYYFVRFVSRKVVAGIQPDYVFLYNYPSLATLKILRYCRRHNVPVIGDITEWEEARGYSVRECIRRFDIWVRMKFCIKHMDGVIAISRYLYDYYSPYTKCILVPPTVDLNDEKFERNRVLSVGEEVQLVYAGVTGNGNKDKLDSVVDTMQNYPMLRLNVVGMSKAQYENNFGALNDGVSNVFFEGRLSHRDAVHEVCDADFQLIIRANTLKNNAGFPTKFVESMSCCTPVIATLTSNIGEYLIDGKNGFVVDGNRTLDKVLSEISAMNHSEIVKMKEACRDTRVFDYRNYKKDFEYLLSQ